MSTRTRIPRSPSMATRAAATAYDALAASYDQTFQTPLALAENDLVFSRLQSFLMREDRVLDLGCGTGLYLEYMPPASDPHGDRYLGVDISTEMLKVAQRKFPSHQFRYGDVADLSQIEDASYTAAVSLFGSMSYTDRFDEAMGEVCRVLCRGGRFFLMLFTPRYKTRASYILNQHELSSPASYYTEEGLRSLFARRFPVMNLRVQGFHAYAETRLPSRLPRAIQRAYLELESATIGRVAPDRCYYLLVSGERL